MEMQLPFLWELPDEIKRRFGERGAGRQRAMVADGHLLLVLHKAPKHDERDRKAVFFWRRPTGEWEHSGKGGGLPALRRHIDEYSQAERRFSDEFAQATTAEDYFRILQGVAPVHHAAINLHTTLQAAREAIPDDRDIIDLRDWAYDLERTLDLLYVDTKNALDYHVAHKSEEEARLSLQSIQIANRLNTLAAIFFPLTAIASVFGMNLRSGFEGAAGMFWLVLLAGIGLGYVAREWVLRWGGRTYS
jgi:hypothetical protein